MIFPNECIFFALNETTYFNFMYECLLIPVYQAPDYSKSRETYRIIFSYLNSRTEISLIEKFACQYTTKVVSQFFIKNVGHYKKLDIEMFNILTFFTYIKDIVAYVPTI